MTGAEGEEIASNFLKNRGYIILTRNFRTSYGEIDIVAKEGVTLVFVEVKARSGRQFGTPELAVDLRKQEKLSRVALLYLSQKYPKGCPCRFDVVAVQQGKEGVQVALFQNAFELPDCLR
jgi:putative endonuclease